MSVARRPLGSTDLTVPILGHGTVPLGASRFAPADVQPLVDGLIEAGINLFDTAAAYDASEERLGTALQGRRDEVVLVTKTAKDRGYAPVHDPVGIQRLITRSLQRLRTECVDVLLLHSCTLDVLEHGAVIEALQDARAKGQTRFIGYSGDGPALAFAIRSGLLDVIETSYSLLDQANHDLMAAAHAAGMGVLLKRPLANAVPGRTTRPPSDYAAAYWPRWQAMDLEPADVDGLPWMEVALRFAAFEPAVTSALVGSGSLAHMREHVAALDQGPLPAPITDTLRTRFAQAAHGRWPGLT